jgi:hypothetical protein
MELFDFLAVDRTGCDACFTRWLCSEPMANMNVCHATQLTKPQGSFVHTQSLKDQLSKAAWSISAYFSMAA